MTRAVTRAEGATLRAVFFDIDDTLYSTTEFAERARCASVDAMIAAGLRVEPEACLRELREIISEFGSNYDRHYEKLLGRFPVECLGRVNPAVVIASGIVAYHQVKVRELRPFPEVPGVLAALARTPLLLGCVTSGLTVKQAEKLVRLGLTHHLRPEAIFITEQVGIGKSNPKLFGRACREVGVRPEEAMYVGDNPQDDVDPPNAAGLVTVLRRGQGRHALDVGRTRPDYEIEDLRALLPIVRRDFGIAVAEAGA